MRDVNYGWLLRYAHANGASMFFIVVYIHIFRGLYYGSYKAPRELLWMLGVVILLLMMATAFMGYVLPWGQMSFWGATVITNLFSAIPLVGQSDRDLAVGRLLGRQPDPQPLLLAALPAAVRDLRGRVPASSWRCTSSARTTRSASTCTKKDKIPFHPYYTVKDCFGLGVFLIVFAFFIFYCPNCLGHPDNYIPANPLRRRRTSCRNGTSCRSTRSCARSPSTILWFIPAKLAGVIAMFGVDPGPVPPALARHLAGPQRHVPADLQVVLLAAGASTASCWAASARTRRRAWSAIGSARHALLLRLLPGHPAAARQARAAAAAAESIDKPVLPRSGLAAQPAE